MYLCPWGNPEETEEGMNRHLIANMTWPEAEKRIREAKAVILPLGSTEQHGYHMAAGTDTIVSDFVCLALAQKPDAWFCLRCHMVRFGPQRGFPQPYRFVKALLSIL
jgi:hypothetical protein